MNVSIWKSETMMSLSSMVSPWPGETGSGKGEGGKKDNPGYTCPNTLKTVGW